MRKSNQGKGDYWAPCPFHQENRLIPRAGRQGVLLLLAVRPKGMPLGLSKKPKMLGSMEAVEILAAEAGMSVQNLIPKWWKRRIGAKSWPM